MDMMRFKKGRREQKRGKEHEKSIRRGTDVGGATYA